MASNSQQRNSIISALILHLEICENKCKDHDLFRYLIDNGNNLNPFYGEIPMCYKGTKKNKVRQGKVQFDHTISCSDGQTDKVCNYKVCVNHTHQILYLGNSLLDTSFKELYIVPLSKYQVIKIGNSRPAKICQAHISIQKNSRCGGSLQSALETLEIFRSGGTG